MMIPELDALVLCSPRKGSHALLITYMIPPRDLEDLHFADLGCMSNCS